MKKINLLLGIILCSVMLIYAEDVIPADKKISVNDSLLRTNYYFPMYKAINDAFYASFQYPATAQEEGRVVILYSVYKRGRATQAKIVKGLSQEIDAQVLEAFKKSSADIKMASGFRGNNYIQTFYIGQSKDKQTVYAEDENIYSYDSPELINAMTEYIQQNLQYPVRAMESKLSGKVMTSFILDESGNVKCGVVEGAVAVDLDREALRVVANMPSFSPYTQNGKAVSSYFILPIYFIMR